jgi:hypothetical protein
MRGPFGGCATHTTRYVQAGNHLIIMKSGIDCYGYAVMRSCQ